MALQAKIMALEAKPVVSIVAPVPKPAYKQPARSTVKVIRQAPYRVENSAQMYIDRRDAGIARKNAIRRSVCPKTSC